MSHKYTVWAKCRISECSSWWYCTNSNHWFSNCNYVLLLPWLSFLSHFGVMSSDAIFLSTRISDPHQNTALLDSDHPMLSHNFCFSQFTVPKWSCQNTVLSSVLVWLLSCSWPLKTHREWHFYGNRVEYIA